MKIHPWRIVTIEELEEREALRWAVPVSSPDHPSMLKHDEEAGYIDVYWGGYEYSIGLDRITKPFDVFSWLIHLGEKGWSHATAERAAYLIEAIFSAKGWSIYEEPSHPNAAPPAKEAIARERAKMTSAIRYDAIRRDGYRCRACGFSVQDGAHLHVDHIVAVANGGKTEMKNLQTLCTVCNLGKGAK